MKIEIEIPDGKRAEWVNGVLTLVDDKPIEYKFKVGDRVLCKDGAKYKITGLSEVNGMPGYSVLGFSHLIISEADFVRIDQGITERIKTFDDAVKWCDENGHGYLVTEYERVDRTGCGMSDDVEAYMALRIITAALNEGWEPTFGKHEMLWCVEYDCTDNICEVNFHFDWATSSVKLAFKSNKLAEYASTQFRDFYADFFGIKKGGEQ